MSRNPSTIYTTYSDIPYVTNGHTLQKLDLYLPNTDLSSPTSPLPLVIYVHGGGFAFEDKVFGKLPLALLDSPPKAAVSSTSKCEPIPSSTWGIALASLNYRLSVDTKFPGPFQDIRSAIRFLRANASTYNLDPNRFIIWGESAGGHMALLAGVTSPLRSSTEEIKFSTDDSSSENEKFDFKLDIGDHLDTSAAVQGVISHYAPTDFLRMDDHNDSSGFTNPPPMPHLTPTSPESQYLNHPITEVPGLVARANPIEYVRSVSTSSTKDSSSVFPPFFLAHGTEDPIVHHSQTLLLDAALVEAGVERELIIVEGGKHAWDDIGADDMTNLENRMGAFLSRVLKF